MHKNALVASRNQFFCRNQSHEVCWKAPENVILTLSEAQNTLAAELVQHSWAASAARDFLKFTELQSQLDFFILLQNPGGFW